MTAVSVALDMQNGVVDRFRSMDIRSSSVMTGHVVASVLRNAVATLLVVGLAFVTGFRPSAGPLDWLAAGALLALFVLAISWAAAAIGLLARTPEGATPLAHRTARWVTHPFATWADPADDAANVAWVRAFRQDIDRYTNGGTYLNPSLGARLAAQPPEPAGPPDDLSERELSVLRLIALGYTNSEIAGDLHLSVRTVESHRAHIQQKTRRASRSELVRYALDHGLVEL